MANPDDEKLTLDSAPKRPDEPARPDEQSVPDEQSEQSEQSVPTWQELPEYAQTDLAPRGYDAAWFAAATPELRLTVLTLFVKLKGMNLWRFVGTESESQQGCLHFLCPSLAELKATLRDSADFTNPGSSQEDWDSRERRSVGALHFKHFPGWPESKVQAHIDPYGARLHSDLWFLVPVVPLGQLLAHLADPTGYTEVFRVRTLLLEQGWDPAPLVGV